MPEIGERPALLMPDAGEELINPKRLIGGVPSAAFPRVRAVLGEAAHRVLVQIACTAKNSS